MTNAMNARNAELEPKSYTTPVVRHPYKFVIPDIVFGAVAQWLNGMHRNSRGHALRRLARAMLVMAGSYDVDVERLSVDSESEMDRRWSDDD